MTTVHLPEKRSRNKTPESGVLRACLDLLAAEKIFHRRWNTGAVRNESGRPVRFGQKGDADIQALIEVPYTRSDGKAFHYVLWIECKSSTGKQSEDQKIFQCEVEQAGHYYLLVRDVDQLRDWLRERGFIG